MSKQGTKPAGRTRARKLPPCHCPRCGYYSDAARSIDKEDDAQPTPGDFSLCLNCGTLLRFNARRRLVLPPSELPGPLELVEARVGEMLLRAQSLIRERGRLERPRLRVVSAADGGAA